MRDGYGDPILPPQALGNKWFGLFMPFTSKEYEDDPIKKEGARLSVKLPQFSDHFGGNLQEGFDINAAMPGDRLPVKLSSEERERWQVIYKNILRHPENGIAKMMEKDEYKNGTFALQRAMFQDFLVTGKAAAKDALIVESDGLARKVAAAEAGKILPMLQPDQREGVEQQVSESLDLLDSVLPEQRDNLMRFGILGPESEAGTAGSGQGGAIP
jgi:hypothetical protein